MKLQLPGKKTRYWQVFWLCLLAAAALPETTRAEQVTLAQWKALAAAYGKMQ